MKTREFLPLRPIVVCLALSLLGIFGSEGCSRTRRRTPVRPRTTPPSVQEWQKESPATAAVQPEPEPSAKTSRASAVSRGSSWSSVLMSGRGKGRSVKSLSPTTPRASFGSTGGESTMSQGDASAREVVPAEPYPPEPVPETTDGEPLGSDTADTAIPQEILEPGGGYGEEPPIVEGLPELPVVNTPAKDELEVDTPLPEEQPGADSPAEEPVLAFLPSGAVVPSEETAIPPDGIGETKAAEADSSPPVTDVEREPTPASAEGILGLLEKALGGSESDTNQPSTQEESSVEEPTEGEVPFILPGQEGDLTPEESQGASPSVPEGSASKKPLAPVEGSSSRGPGGESSPAEESAPDLEERIERVNKVLGESRVIDEKNRAKARFHLKEAERFLEEGKIERARVEADRAWKLDPGKKQEVERLMFKILVKESKLKAKP